MVLTAGHCAIDEALLTFPGVSIVFGRDADDFDAREIDVESWTIHPKYAGEGKGYDVALFTLETEVKDVTPMTLASTPLADSAAGTMVRHVGYGKNSESEGGEGIKRTATYPVTKVEPLLIGSGAPGKQTCDGDSGGPALLRVGNADTIVAVTSDGPSCHEDGADARVDVKEIHDWIVETAKLPASPTTNPTPSTDGEPSGPTGNAPSGSPDAHPRPPGSRLADGRQSPVAAF
jgi:secreted trypsin-like serine protease